MLTLATLVSISLVVPPLLGMAIDPKVITGANAWIKPLKFAIASAVYGASFLGLLTFVEGRPRLVRALGNVTAVVLVLEVVLITMQVARGTTSHFNAATVFDAAVFSIMGSAITVLALVNLALGILLLRQRMTDPVLASGLRLGVFASFLGMMVAFLMTSPTEEQLDAMRAGVEVAAVGAHSVGVPDGGPGLPFLGWSLEGGDLRVPHFVGIHGMQVLALLGWLLALPVARRRWSETERLAFVRIGGASYIGWVGLLTWQALRGQSVVSFDRQTGLAYVALFGIAGLGALLVSLRRRLTGGSTQGGLELDELLSHRGPVVSEESERFVLDTLPLSVGARVDGDALRGEPSVALPPVLVGREVDEPIAAQRLDVSADRRRVAPDRVREVAERHASGHAQRRQDRPLGAADPHGAEGVVVGGSQRTARASHARADATHRRPHVDVELLSHSLYMHLFAEDARGEE
jgi:hypothetical protein